MATSPPLRVLLTGGAGYIGAHCAAVLLGEGHEVTVLDNLERGHRAAVERVGQLSGRPVDLVVGDVRDPEALARLFAARPFDAVVHLAALKSVEESTGHPERYHETNVVGTANLCAAMERHGVRRLVFSSSAAVYGDCGSGPATEDAALCPLSPYGRTKVLAEDHLSAAAERNSGAAVSLRYFNPVGAHPSARIGECGDGATNLIPILMDVALGRRPGVSVFGRDYDTPDGTCIRDYIHVMDLADAHCAALASTAQLQGARVYNVGTGRGHSVLEVLDRARAVTGSAIPALDAARRKGDAVQLVADVTRIQQELRWTARQGLAAMLRSEWAWRTACPDGYSTRCGAPEPGRLQDPV